MIPLLLGTMLLVAVGVGVTASCASEQDYGMPSPVLAPVAVLGMALALVPVGLELGGAFAEAARWLWLGVGVLSIPAALALHGALSAIRDEADAVRFSVRMPPPGGWTSSDRLAELDNSIESALKSVADQRVAETTPHGSAERW